MIEIYDNLNLIQAIQACTIASLIGMFMGVERAFYNKVASIRTFAFISLGSCIFTVLSYSIMTSMSDPTRLAAQIISGIGFIGGGVILKNDNKIEGITTASMMFLAASFGMICGFGYSIFAFFSFMIYLIVLVLGKILHELVDKLKGI